MDVVVTGDGVAADHEAIRNLLSEYCHAVDEARFADVETLFTPEAVVTARLAGTTYRGPAEIRRFLEVQPAEMRGLHVTVNPAVTVEGTHARARADFFVLVERNGTSVVGAWGRYHDRLVRTAGGWRFTERHVETQWRVTDTELAR